MKKKAVARVSRLAMQSWMQIIGQSNPPRILLYILLAANRIFLIMFVTFASHNFRVVCRHFPVAGRRLCRTIVVLRGQARHFYCVLFLEKIRTRIFWKQGVINLVLVLR